MTIDNTTFMSYTNKNMRFIAQISQNACLYDNRIQITFDKFTDFRKVLLSYDQKGYRAAVQFPLRSEEARITEA